MKVITTSVLLTMSTIAFSSFCCAEKGQWLNVNSDQERMILVSTTHISDHHSGVLKVSLSRSTGENVSTCDVTPSFTRENITQSMLKELPRSLLSNCTLGANLGSEVYRCHIQTIASRSLQSITLSIVPDKKSFLTDAILFSRYLNVSVARTIKTEPFDLRYDLSGLSTSISDWCRNAIGDQ